MKKLALNAALVATAVIAAAGGATAQDAIRVGVLLPVSGGAASVGEGINTGINLAVEQINAAGGVLGRPLEVLLRDTQLSPDVASSAARELITREEVVALIGPATSGASLAVSALAREEGVVNISPSAKADAITAPENLHDYIFQLAPTTDVDGVRMVDILREAGAESICFVGFDYAYTHDLFRNIRANMEGMEETGEYLVPTTATDYSTMITQLLGNECDTVVGTMFGGGFISFVQQATPFGLFDQKTLVWGSNMGDYAMLSALGSDFPEGMWASASDAWYYEGDTAHSEFQAALAEAQGREETDMWPVTGYNAVHFLAAAIEAAGTTDADAVAAALEGLTVSTPLGDITIDTETHRAGSPEFYGRVGPVEGSDIMQMLDVELVR